MTVGFIGGGNMAEALIKGMVSHGRKDICVGEPREQRRAHLVAEYGVRATADNSDVAASSGIVVFAVKPQEMEAAVDGVKGLISEEQTVVSIAAGITLEFFKKRLKTSKLVRAMPNLGAFVGEGMTVLSLYECLIGGDIEAVRDIFMSVGRVVTLPEGKMNAVTALSGSGPAFVALFIEAMAEAGSGLGLTRDEAMALAVQTATGTLKMLDGGTGPKKLREMVTSPGGTTAEGLKVFEARGLGATVSEALGAAARRAGELAR